jgi:hypothetical protein
MIRRCLIGVLTLVLGGCLMRGSGTAVYDATTGTRLATTIRSGLFLTTVRIGGRDAGPFLIDTGSTVNVIDTDLAQTLPLRILQARYDTESQQTIRLAAVGDLTVGPITLRDPSVVIMDLSSITSGFGERIAGVLGYPFFATAVVEVDYVRQSVSCFDPAGYRLPRGAWQPLILRMQLPGAAARMDGDVEGVFVLDTGSNGTVHFFSHFVQKHPRLEIRNVAPRRNLRVGGERDILGGQIGWLELSGHRFERPRVVFQTPDGPVPRAADSFDGIIGERFLREFVVIFNYPEGKIAFLPREPA